MAKTGLEEFKRVVTDFRSLSSLAVNSAIAAPLAALVVKIGPPWPTEAPVITSVAEMVVLICIFQFWPGKSKKQMSRLMIISLIVLSVSFIGYFYAFDSFTFSIPSSGRTAVKGFVLRPDVAPLINNQFTPDDALQGAEYKPDQVWAAWSITSMRTIILVAWLIMFISLASFMGSFVIYQKHRLIKQPLRSTKKQRPHAYKKRAGATPHLHK